MMALPTDAQLSEMGASHAGEFFSKLEDAEGLMEVDAFKAKHSLNMTDALPDDQPMEQKLTQFLEWLVYSVRGGKEAGGTAVKLNKDTLKRFVKTGSSGKRKSG
jgi:hypothetical protein